MDANFTALAKTLHNEHLLKTEALFETKKFDWFASFAEHFQATCAEIHKLQSASCLPAVSYLEYNMLYTNFINRRYAAEAAVYGKKSYLDKKQRMISAYDIAPVFVYFDELWNALNKTSKDFSGKVSPHDITHYMLREALPDFYFYVASIARFAVMDCAYTKPFTEIIKNDVFKINIGDYMVLTEPVYIYKKDKDAKKITDWFAQKLPLTYNFNDFSNLDFSGCQFQDNDLRYSYFRECVLVNTTFAESSLDGCCFYKADMEGCDLSDCILYEANFERANLKNARFADSRAGLPGGRMWSHPGFLHANFRHTDLTGANFSACNLFGADFTGATLTDADFTGAILDNAVFSDTNLPLTEEQKSKIIIVKE